MKNWNSFSKAQNIDDRRYDYVYNYLPNPQRYDGQIAMHDAPAAGGLHAGLSGVGIQQNPISTLLADQAGLSDIKLNDVSPLEALMRSWVRPEINSIARNR